MEGVVDPTQYGTVPAELLRLMAERSPSVMVVAAAPDFRIVFANRAAHRAARSAEGALVGQIAAEAFAFVDSRLLVEERHGRTHARPSADRSGAGTIWWDVTYVSLGADPSDHSRVLITATDVTHHEVDREKAQAAQNTLDALLAYIPEGISISQGPEIHVERVSARGMALLGRNADELTGRSALQQTDVWEVYRPGCDTPLSPNDRPLARATRSGESRLNETLIVRRSDGSMLTLLCNSGPIRDAAGQVTGAIMSWQDVTDLLRAQAVMRASDERLRAVLLQIPAAIFIVEAPDGRVAFKSRLVDELLGHPDPDPVRAKATLRGWAVHKDGSPYDLSEYPSRRALFNGETVKAEPMQYQRGDGRLIDLEMHAGPVRGETGEVIAAVAVALDVTERHLAEARQAFLFELQDSLRTLTEPREILTAAAAHLGRHLGAARVGYGEMQPDDETVMITNGYVDGVPPVSGLFPLKTFGAYHAAQMRDGKTVVYEDVQSDERGAREFGMKLGTRAHISVPLIRHGRYTGSLYVTRSRPHQWSSDEVALIEEVAARIWDAAERGRAEARLRESEERLRLVMDSTGLGYWEYDVTSGKTIRSARHDEILGYSSPVVDWSIERFATHIPEPDRAIVEAGLRAALEGQVLGGGMPDDPGGW
jgi:PAS domain S-box-containing protein